MNDLIWQLYQFVGLMIARLYQKHDEGWQDWENIEEDEYLRRARRNLGKRHYVDAANLCMLAYFREELSRKEASHEG